jgi:DNA-binding LacI/PurR family transcriptional regulator
MDHQTSTKQSKVTLRTVADHTGLTPGTISAVLNNTPGARRIPETTRDRILAAARELKYQPNPLARALRTGQAVATSTDGQEFGNTRGALVIMDADHFLLAINAIQQAGLRVPDDVSVVEFDSFPAAAMNYSTFDAAANAS